MKRNEGSKDNGSKEARSQILGRLRRSLDVIGHEPARRDTVRQHLTTHARNIVPARGDLDPERRVALFADMLHAVEATTARVALNDVAAEIGRYLARQDLPLVLRCGADELIAAIDWSSLPDIVRTQGPAEPADTASLARAFAGAAETGTLFLASGSGNPVSLAFLPETSIVLIQARDIVGSYEEAIDLLRARLAGGPLPRTLCLVSGPSRTADIEQTLVTGAHGPCRLHVIVID